MNDLINILSKNDFNKLEIKLKDKNPKLLALIKNARGNNSFNEKDKELDKPSIRNKVEYSKLKKELETNIFDTLFSSKIENYFSLDFAKTDILISKQVILAKFAIENKLYPIAKKLLLKSLKQSIKFEMYSRALEVKKSLLILNSILRVQDEIDACIKMCNSLNKIRNIVHTSEMIYARAIYLYDSRETNDFYDFCKNNLTFLKNNMKKIDSTIVSFFYLDLASKLYIKKRNYKKAREFTLYLIELLQKNQTLFSKNWIGQQKLKLADICLYTKNFSLGIKQVKEALPLVKRNKHLYSQILNTYYHLSLNAGLLDERAYALNEMGKIKVGSWDIYFPEKVKFYTAACLFSIGEKEKTLQILQKLNTLIKDKKGWGLGVRLLEIMTMFDLNMTDLLDYKLQNLRLFIYNQRLDNDSRLKAIYNCLRLMRRINIVEETKIIEKIEPHLSNLRSNKTNYFWDPKSYETIRFDTWLSEKISEL